MLFSLFDDWHPPIHLTMFKLVEIHYINQNLLFQLMQRTTGESMLHDGNGIIKSMS
ncbi:hypothetical protein Scep_015819 [Stephania cephalantha]|uniref:Uncharacterized protein n=1 Tax=Stephania cephalantha TaxID=152367 RepID=A0AAP0J3W9_9MAGN